MRLRSNKHYARRATLRKSRPTTQSPLDALLIVLAPICSLFSFARKFCGFLASLFLLLAALILRVYGPILSGATQSITPLPLGARTSPVLWSSSLFFAGFRNFFTPGRATRSVADACAALGRFAFVLGFFPVWVVACTRSHSGGEIVRFCIAWVASCLTVVFCTSASLRPCVVDQILFSSSYRHRRTHSSNVACRRLRALATLGLIVPFWVSVLPFGQLLWHPPSYAKTVSYEPHCFTAHMRGGGRIPSAMADAQPPTPEAVKLWRDAGTWLDACVADAGSNDSTRAERSRLVERCRRRLARLPKDMPVLSWQTAQMTTTLLVELLGSHWLRDEHINSGTEFVSRESDNSTIFLSCFHLGSLRNYRARAAGPYHPKKSRYGDSLIRSGCITTVVIPAFVNGNHWTRFVIDLENGLIEYMDPMFPHAKAPTELLSNLRWWLASLTPGTVYRISPSSSPPPKQNDCDSCGVAVLSTCAADFTGYEYWTQSTWREHRMEWFLRLSGAFFDDELQPPEGDLDSSDAVNPLPSEPGPSQRVTTAQSVECHAQDWEALEDSSEPFLPLAPVFMPRGPSDEELELDLDFNLIPNSDPDDSDEENTRTKSSSKKRPSSSATPPAKRAKTNSVSTAKPGTSYARQRDLREQSKGEDFVPHAAHLRRFRMRIRSIDPDAEFESKTWRSVRCSRCSVWVKMRMLYECHRFRTHRSTPSCQKHTGRQLSLSGFAGFTAARRTKNEQPRTIMCPGLTAESDSRIERYLSRSGSLGGGAPSLIKLSYQLFGCTWSELSLDEKADVRRLEQHSQRWTNRRGVRAVFSNSCHQTLQIPRTKPTRPCAACSHLLELKAFKNAINRPMPDDEDLKFTPEWNRSPELGLIYTRYTGVRDLVEANTESVGHMLLQYARGVLSGRYKSQDIMLGAIQAFMEKARRQELGMKNTGMKYPLEFDNLCATLLTISPRAYRTFREAFGGRTVRSFRGLRSASRVVPGISEDGVRAAANILASYNYHGPVVLACDDTKLERSLREMSAPDGAWMVVGHVGEPVLVTSDEDFAKLVKDAELVMGTKMRLWALIVPIPKVPPIILAVEARGEDESAEDLYAKHKPLIDLLSAHNIHPIAYACDGTETERKLQRLITADAVVQTITIQNSRPGFEVSLSIPHVNGHPMIMVQDSKHGAKTARNQLFSGAISLTLGNFHICYQQFHMLAMLDDSPIFHRDVVKVDRQDDRAAARMFSAAFLEHVVKHAPKERGTALYLFFFGGLFDAWQSRHMAHSVRILLALRCYFFIRAWAAHIDIHPEHTRYRNFISRESFDIFQTICLSLISLIVTYRERFPDFPFLAWLHSTEPVEHIFGVMRMLKPDFTLYDFLLFLPRLAAYLMGAFGSMSAAEQANRTASGYWHHYSDDSNVSLSGLAKWPTDAEIARISERAAQDVQVAMQHVVGVDAEKCLGGKYAAKGPSAATTKTAPTKRARQPKPPPPPRERLPRSCASLCRLPADVVKAYADDDEDTTFTSMAEVLASREALSLQSSNIERDMDATIAAISAADMHQTDNIASLAESDATHTAAAAQQIQDFIRAAQSFTIPAASAASTDILELPPPLTAELKDNLMLLVEERRTHENDFTKRALRAARSATVISESAQSATRLKDSLGRHLETLVASAAPTNTSGYRREERWKNGPARGADLSADTARALRQNSHRQAAYQSFSVAIHARIVSGNVNSDTPLDVTAGPVYVLAFTTKKHPRLIFGQISAMYTTVSRRHAPVEQTSNLAGLSYLPVREFKKFGATKYTSLAYEPLDSATMHHLSPHHILFTFTGFDVQRVEDDTTPSEALVWLTPGAPCRKVLDSAFEREQALVTAFKAFKKARSGGNKAKEPTHVAEDVDSDSEDEEYEDEEDEEL